MCTIVTYEDWRFNILKGCCNERVEDYINTVSQHTKSLEIHVLEGWVIDNWRRYIIRAFAKNWKFWRDC